MKEMIGETAGRIWQKLSDGGDANVAGLPKSLNEKAQIVHMALGWLAREDKIAFRTEKAKTFVMLKK